MTVEAMARQAYRAYGDYVDWKNYAGDPMPPWEELPLQVRIAWQVSSLRVVDLMFAEAKHALLGVKT